MAKQIIKQIIKVDVDSGKLISVTDEAGTAVKPHPNHPAAAMATLSSPAGKRKMIITIDAATGNPLSVTDEEGVPTERTEATPENPLVLGKIVGGAGHAILHTRNSPGCTYYYYNGGWRRVC